MPELQWLVAAFPNFVRYVVVGFALAALFLWIYVLITPWREFALIRAGNSAAAIALVGALLGFCLPLANTIAHSVSLTDVVLWALVALVVQVIVHVAMRLIAARPQAGDRGRPDGRRHHRRRLRGLLRLDQRRLPHDLKMTMPSPPPSGGPRMSRGIKLVLMGVAGAALLYSCSPGIGAGLGALPYLWFFSNPFYRGPAVSAPATPGSSATNPDGQQTPRLARASAAASAARDRRAARRARAETCAVKRRRRGPAGRANSSSWASTTTYMDGKAYWTEQACYAFTSDEIDELEAATEELHGICLKAVEYVVANKLWERMRIPPAWGDYIEQVWRRADPTLCRPLRSRL